MFGGDVAIIGDTLCVHHYANWKPHRRVCFHKVEMKDEKGDQII